MSVLRRMMMGGFNIEAIPSSRKIYYTASEKITPSRNSLGSEVQLNMYNATTMNGVIVTESDITSIGTKAFEYCPITSITIPDSVTSIGESAFSRSKLTSITIPDSVTNIGDYAFSWCTKLTSVYCKAATPPSLSGAFVFDQNGSGRKIYVPMESVDAYKSATNWSSYADAIEGYEF